MGAHSRWKRERRRQQTGSRANRQERYSKHREEYKLVNGLLVSAAVLLAADRKKS